VLSTEARVALTLRLLGGLTTEEIARAVPGAGGHDRPADRPREADPVRRGVPFEVPRGDDLAARLSSVLEVVYLVFNEGYAATAGDDWTRPALCEDALRLGRILAELVPQEPEVHGLVRAHGDPGLAARGAHGARRRAHPAARPGPLALESPARPARPRGARARGGARPAAGPYVLQAAIAACHGRARTAEETDWPRIAALYAALLAIVPSPVVALNRAVAVGMAEGPAAALPLVDALLDQPRCAATTCCRACAATCCGSSERHPRPRPSSMRAASLTRNAPERALRQRDARPPARRYGVTARAHQK
jgi:predicted RNA polymerase sigma factor